MKPIHARAALTAATAAAVVLLAAPAADAHITVDPDEAEQGGYATLNVRVPNERDDAATIRVELHLDPEHPLASVMPQPVPGWEVEVTTAELDEPLEVHGSRITEAPSVVTWTGGAIEPGTFQQFPLSVGPLPEDADRLVLDATQTYDNDEVVRWIEEPAEGGAEPETPSPVLNLTPAADGGHGHGAGEEDAAAEDGEPVAADADGDADGDGGTTDTTARVLAVAGLALGVAGVAFGVLAGRRPRRSDDS
ncbi:YcnI family protein [Streptomyces sp. DSM 44917]|uniref:YcnI family protein n=1 Tax=Streptomyces boetiae TaxID=3075541 RepID=A0ABU2LE34_9ACTN|nr:YcnI family protein [Streptomyces sp. DSM 44917]MDT0309857.1 YcnI family protein [Streptomyces sp. DSM 44917]